MIPGPLIWAWLELKSERRVKFGVWKREWRTPLPGQVPGGIITEGVLLGRPRVSVGKECGPSLAPILTCLRPQRCK